MYGVFKNVKIVKLFVFGMGQRRKRREEEDRGQDIFFLHFPKRFPQNLLKQGSSLFSVTKRSFWFARFTSNIKGSRKKGIFLVATKKKYIFFPKKKKKISNLFLTLKKN